MINKNVTLISTSGFARCGKNLFCSIASKILYDKKGFKSIEIALADELKKEMDEFLYSNTGIKSNTDNNEEKKLIRPMLVAWGCLRRNMTNGNYWINKLENKINLIMNSFEFEIPNVIFVPDIRFKNEADYILKNNGYLIHISKYTTAIPQGIPTEISKNNPDFRLYQFAPNDEELENDPIVNKISNYNLEWEDITTSGLCKNKEELINNAYLNELVENCLVKLNIL